MRSLPPRADGAAAGVAATGVAAAGVALAGAGSAVPVATEEVAPLAVVTGVEAVAGDEAATVAAGDGEATVAVAGDAAAVAAVAAATAGVRDRGTRDGPGSGPTSAITELTALRLRGAPLPCAMTPEPGAVAPLPGAVASLPCAVVPLPCAVAPLPCAVVPLPCAVAPLPCASSVVIRSEKPRARLVTWHAAPPHRARVVSFVLAWWQPTHL
jgi:hypothetical protein